jgi:hypothetical protein
LVEGLIGDILKVLKDGKLKNWRKRIHR